MLKLNLFFRFSFLNASFAILIFIETTRHLLNFFLTILAGHLYLKGFRWWSFWLSSFSWIETRSGATNSLVTRIVDCFVLSLAFSTYCEIVDVSNGDDRSISGCVWKMTCIRNTTTTINNNWTTVLFFSRPVDQVNLFVLCGNKCELISRLNLTISPTTTAHKEEEEEEGRRSAQRWIKIDSKWHACHWTVSSPTTNIVILALVSQTTLVLFPFFFFVVGDWVSVPISNCKVLTNLTLVMHQSPFSRCIFYIEFENNFFFFLRWLWIGDRSYWCNEQCWFVFCFVLNLIFNK